jgi:hypothetical protein
MLALAPSAASAQPPPEGEDARALFVRGQTAYAEADYDTAIALWTRAYELDPRPALQFNLSQAYERLGRLEDAVRALQLFLDRAEPTSDHVADARARLSAMRERIARTSVRVTGGPEGATILVDDQDHGRTPRPDPIAVSPGSHTIVVRLAGRSDFTSSVVVPAGQTVDVEVRGLAAVAAPSSSGPPVGAIVVLAGGAAVAVTGAILGGVALGEVGGAVDGTPQADRARALAIATDVLIPVGAACAVAGLIWWLVEEGSRPATETVAILPYATEAGAGVTAAGSF